METGKFSQPRDEREEERQIEEAFRQITEKKNPPRRQVKPIPEAAANSFTEDRTETLFVSAEELIPEKLRNLPLPQQTEEESIEDSIAREIEKEYPPQPAAPEPAPSPVEPAEEWDIDYAEEDYEPEPENFLESAMVFFQSHQKVILAALFAAALVMILACVGIFTANSSAKDDGKILNNVMVAGVNVGGMTKEEAISAVKKATNNTYSHQDMVIDIAGTKILLSPKETGASLDVKAAVEAAYRYGRTGTQAEQENAQANALLGNHTVGLLPYLKLDKEYIQETLNRHAADSGSTLSQVSYGLEGTYPTLNTLGFDPTAAQTLVLTMGTPGITFDADLVYNQILDAYSLHTFLVTVEDVHSSEEPDPVDLQAIYDEFYVAPVDDRMNLQTFETIPGSYGYEFDLEEARKLVETANYADVIRIPMRFIEPQLLEENVLFRDVIGEYRTDAYTKDKDRISNIRLACQAINGKVLQPGETFSFNNIVGQPSAAKGYKEAANDYGEVSMGYGINQVATTLYCSALISDLEVVSRSAPAHSLNSDVMGLDAEIIWGHTDLKLRNNGSYPVQISASASGGTVTVQILGTEDRDYFIKLSHEVTDTHEPKTEYVYYTFENSDGYQDGDVIQEGIVGYTVKSYKMKYSRSNGKLVSKDYEATTRYATVNCVYAQVAPPETTVPETTVPETTVPETPVPETTVPETTVPETTVPETTIPETTAAPETIVPETTAPLIIPENENAEDLSAA